MAKPEQNTALFDTHTTFAGDSGNPVRMESYNYQPDNDHEQASRHEHADASGQVNSMNVIASVVRGIGERNSRESLAALYRGYDRLPPKLQSTVVRDYKDRYFAPKVINSNLITRRADELTSAAENFHELAKAEWEEIGKPLGKIAVAMASLMGGNTKAADEQALNFENLDRIYFKSPYSEKRRKNLYRQAKKAK